MVTAYNNRNVSVILGLKSNCAVNTIEHEIVFQSNAECKMRWVKNYIRLKH